MILGQAAAIHGGVDSIERIKLPDYRAYLPATNTFYYHTLFILFLHYLFI